jgi:hypothetical protein
MFKFAIRDVLWLTVVVALAAAWFVDRSRLVKLAEERKTWELRAQSLAESLEELHYRVGYDREGTHIKGVGLDSWKRTTP